MNFVIVLTSDRVRFTLLSNNPILEGSGFGCVNLNDPIPIHSKNFIDLVYYQEVTGFRRIFELLKLILPHSMKTIENYFSTLFLTFLSKSMRDYLNRRNIDIVRIIEECKDFKSFENYSKNHTRAYNDYSCLMNGNPQEKVKFTREMKYDILYKYDTFNEKLIADMKIHKDGCRYQSSYCECQRDQNFDHLKLIKIFFKDVNMMKYIIDNFDAETNSYILMYICMFSVVEILEYFIKKWSLGISNYSPGYMHSACKVGNLEIVKYLIEYGCDIYSSEYGTSPIFYTLKEGDFEFAKYLIEKGAKIECQDKDRLRPIHYAIKYSSFEIIKLLIEKGAEIESQDKNGLGPMHYALMYPNFEIVKYLIEKGARIESENRNGIPPIHYAIKYCNFEIIKYLIKSGANIDCRDKYEIHSIHYACKYSNFETIKYLIDLNVDLECKNSDMITPFHYICKRFDFEVIKYFIDRGICLYSIDNRCKTAVQYICKYQTRPLFKRVRKYINSLRNRSLNSRLVVS